MALVTTLVDKHGINSQTTATAIDYYDGADGATVGSGPCVAKFRDWFVGDCLMADFLRWVSSELQLPFWEFCLPVLTPCKYS